jgi:geranylgeranyl diphosphate synthase type I
VGAGGRPDDPAIIDAGAALELVHTMAVVHDDVMDASDRRHGVDTIHVGFAKRHAERGWRGDPERFGEGVAILMGDVAHACADRLLASAPPVAADVFERMRLEVNAGQCLDLLVAAGRVPTVEQARRICRYKTATYTVQRPLELGAALAAPHRVGELAGPLSAYGVPLGEAFQLKDDLLGTFGDPATTGKPVGEDLREGKATMLVALAYQGAGPAERALLADRLGAADLTGDEVVRLQTVIEQTGARHQVEQAVARLVEESLAAVNVLPLGEPARTELAGIAHFVAGRDH